jgi:hypothetical protein
MNFPLPAARDFGRATHSLRHAQRANPRNARNPAGLHLSFAGNCSNKRNQLYCLQKTEPLFKVSLIHKPFGIPPIQSDRNML